MKRPKKLALAAVACLVVSAFGIGVGAPANADAGPFEPTVGTVYISTEVGTNQMQLWQAPQLDTGLIFSPNGPRTASGTVYNAQGHRATDGYIYAISHSANSFGHLLRIDKAGGVTDLGSAFSPALKPANNVVFPSGTFGEGAYADTFFYMVRENANLATARQYSDTLNWATFASDGTFTLGSIPLSSRLGSDVADFAPLGGYLWGIGQGKQMVRIDPATGKFDTFSVASNLLPSEIVNFNAAWALPNGNLAFRVQGTGLITQLAVANASTASPRFTTIGRMQGPPDGFTADGTFIPAVPARDVDLSIVKSGSPQVAPGGTVTYTVTVTNNSDYPSSGANIHDDLPAGLTNVTVPDGATLNGQDLFLSVQALDPGESATFTYTGTAPLGTTTLTNSADVVGNEIDPDLTNNTAQVDTQVTDTDSNPDANVNASASAGADANGNPAAQAAANADASTQATCGCGCDQCGGGSVGGVDGCVHDGVG